MAKNAYIGSSSVSHKIKSIYVGASSVARKVIKGYVGVSNVARLFFGGISFAQKTVTYPGGGSGIYNNAYTFADGAISTYAILALIERNYSGTLIPVLIGTNETFREVTLSNDVNDRLGLTPGIGAINNSMYLISCDDYYLVRLSSSLVETDTYLDDVTYPGNCGPAKFSNKLHYLDRDNPNLIINSNGTTSRLNGFVPNIASCAIMVSNTQAIYFDAGTTDKFMPLNSNLVESDEIYTDFNAHLNIGNCMMFNGSRTFVPYYENTNTRGALLWSSNLTYSQISLSDALGNPSGRWHYVLNGNTVLLSLSGSVICANIFNANGVLTGTLNLNFAYQNSGSPSGPLFNDKIYVVRDNNRTGLVLGSLTV